MNLEEFAFLNQQLAAMLRDGIPLEGALRRLGAEMKRGALKEELRQLETDLGNGLPLKDALAGRKLPDFYKQMVRVGLRSNDLPGVLTLLADYYQRQNSIWTRLKGLMVYPLIVIVVALGFTLVVSLTFNRIVSSFFEFSSTWGQPQSPFVWVAGIWVPPVILVLATVLGAAAIGIPSWRAWLRWRLPAFREASLAQVAAAITLMLRNGMTLAEALALAQTLEDNTAAGRTLGEWHRRVVGGQGRPTQWPLPDRPFPPLFLWLVQTGGEDPAAGFQKAAEIYQARASYRIELALYGALPVSILLLGQMIFWQVAPFMKSMIWLMNMLGNFGGGD